MGSCFIQPGFLGLGCLLFSSLPICALQQQARAERWKITSVFKQLHQFQDEQERLLLMWLEDTEKEIVQTQSENDRRISAEISHLGNLIRELEGMNPQPENKSLQVRARTQAEKMGGGCLQHLFSPPSLFALTF